MYNYDEIVELLNGKDFNNITELYYYLDSYTTWNNEKDIIKFFHDNEITDQELLDNWTDIILPRYIFNGVELIDTHIEIPENIIKMQYGAFADSNIVSINCLGVETLHSKVFAGCSQLERIEIPKVTYISIETFQNCSNLTRLEMPKGLYHIGKHAFEGCNPNLVVSVPESWIISDESLWDGDYRNDFFGPVHWEVRGGE